MNKNASNLTSLFIIVTPHIAWNTDYEKRKTNDMMIDNIVAWLDKKPIHIVV